MIRLLSTGEYLPVKEKILPELVTEPGLYRIPATGSYCLYFDGLVWFQEVSKYPIKGITQGYTVINYEVFDSCQHLTV